MALFSAGLALGGCGGQARTTSTSSTVATATAAPSASGAAAVEQQFVAVIKQTQPQVVQIQTDSGLGSGVIFDAKGNIVTNAHVVSGASQLVVTLAAGNSQTGGVAAGIGFAIPSNTVTDIAGQIIRYGRVVNSHRAAIGASIASSSAQPGALIVTVQPGGPASNAGITAGDLIEKIDGAPIADASAIGEALAARRPGDKITLTILQPDGTTSTRTVTLGQLPGS